MPLGLDVSHLDILPVGFFINDYKGTVFDNGHEAIVDLLCDVLHQYESYYLCRAHVGLFNHQIRYLFLQNILQHL